MKDKELRDSFKTMACWICNKRDCDPCHIKTYATTLEDDPGNMIPLCREHHTMQHQKGFAYLFDTYPLFRNKMNRKGYFIETIFGVRKIVRHVSK